jgi:hypothetical protein
VTYASGLTARELDAVEAQMRRSYRMRVLIDLYSYRRHRVAGLASSRIAGSVQVRASREGPTRSLQVDLFDPSDQLNLGDNVKVVRPNRMVRVRRGLFVDDLEDWVDLPVIFGPLSRVSRADDVLTLEAQDRAMFAVGPRPAFTVRAGTNVGTAIRQIMGEAVGETRFRIAATSRKLTKSHTLSRELTPWALVQRLCRSIGWVAFYDGDGYLVCRRRSTTPVTRFREGVGGSLTTEVHTGYWDGDLVNQVIVLGGVISKTQITAQATLAADHPLSPENMRVGDVRWPKTEYIEDSEVDSFAAATELAERRLRELSIQQTTASFEAMPFWHLQEYDPYIVETPTGQVTASVQEMTIPLDCDGMQSFGFNSRTPRSRRPVRIKPKTKRLARAEVNAAKKAAAERRRKRIAAAKKRKAAEKRRAAKARKR